MKKAIVLLTILILWFGGFIAFIWAIERGNKEECCNFKTDAVVVLTGGRDRIGTALLRLKDGLSDKVFISGVSKKVGLKEILNYYNKIELDEDEIKKIEIGNQARNTKENAFEVNQWIENNNIQSILLITSDYHMPRSMIEIKSVNDKIEAIADPVASKYVSKKWWKNPKSFLFLIREYNKFLYVYTRAKIRKTIGDL